MKIVLDTNVLLVALSKKSKYRPIFEAFLNERCSLCITTDIIFEYEEIIGQHLGLHLASNVLQLIENAPNVNLIVKYFKWNLITADADDNKFIDCAVADDANFIVSEDKHLKVLKQIAFPKVVVLTANQFMAII